MAPSYNNVSVDRSTGEIVTNDVNWYVDNGTLYFYDDPINGYDITLLPPSANNSLAVNVIYGGQVSAIVYPFNQTDSNTVMAGNDHLGRTGDNGYANEIDPDAGSKTSIRMYKNNQVTGGNLMMFGNDGLPASAHTGENPHYYGGFTYSNAAYMYTNGSQQIVGFNTVPDGSVESVIITNFSTPVVAGAPSYVNVTQKTIIRNNNLWFATVYYITNSGASNITSFRFYQGSDFNFNGQYTDDDDYYDAANDTVYGHMDNPNPNSIHVGGYRSPIASSMHDVTLYYSIWHRMATDALLNATSTTGVDGGMALSWDNASLIKGQTWDLPVIWAVGSTNGGFSNTLNSAVNNNVYDVGIQSISAPLNGDSLDAQTTPVVTVNATAMDVGVTDQTTKVTMDVKNSTGGVVYTTSTNAILSVPFTETAPVSFNWNLAGVPAGNYTINVYTNLTDASGKNVDQNRSNDMKSITVIVRDFTLYPDQWVHANPGDNVLFPLNLSNFG